MKLEIRPEPSPAERNAIERALAPEAAPRLRSAWREAGVRENTKRQRLHPRTFDAGAADPPESGRSAASQ